MPSDRRDYTRRAVLASGGAALLAGCRTAPESITTGGQSRSDTETRVPDEQNTARDRSETARETDLDLSGEWLMEGYDAANTKHAPDVAVPDGSERWRVTGATEQGDVLGTPAVSGETVFIGNGYRFLALDVATGSLRWDRTLDLQVAFYSPAIHDDTVLVLGSALQSGSSGLYALDSGDGTTHWQVDLPVTSSPVVSDGRAYVSVDRDDGTTLSALDVTDGRERLAVSFDPVDGGARYAPKPAVADGTVYLPVRGLDADGASVLLAADAEDGTVRWRRPVDGEVHTAPAVADGHVYVGTSNGSVVAVDRTTGEIQWQNDTVDEVRHSPSLANGRVFVVDVFGVLYALDATEGTVLWDIEAPPSNRTRPVVGDGTVVLSGDSILAVDAETGDRQWEHRMTQMASYSFTPTALVDGGLLTASCTKTEWSQRMYDNNVHLFV